MNTRQVVLVSATVALCACSAVGLEHLNAPLYAYTRGQGLCSTVTAVEAGGAVWTDTPCERTLSLQRTGQFDDAAVRRLAAAFAALPAPPNPTPACEVDKPGSVLFLSFSKHDASGAVTQWKLCSDSLLGEPVGLKEPFLSLAALFKP